MTARASALAVIHYTGLKYTKGLYAAEVKQGENNMWIVIVIVVFLVVIVAQDDKENAKLAESARLKREQKAEKERQEKVNSMIAESREMKNVPRIAQLAQRVIDCANEHRADLDHIWMEYSFTRIHVSLRDTQKDKWAPVVRGQSFEICSSDVEFRTYEEKAAFMYLILCNCPYLTYKIGAEESRDLKTAYFSTDSNGDFSPYATSLYTKKYSSFDFLRQKG